MPLPLPDTWLNAPEDEGIPYPPEYPSIRLTFDSISVVLDKFTQFEKIHLDGYQVDTNFFGASIIKSKDHIPKRVWNITSFCEQWQRDRVFMICQESDRVLKTPPYTDFEITLDDVAAPELENPTTRTPVALEDPWEDTIEGRTKYFAQYQVGISLETLKEVVNKGFYYEVSFTMVEI